MGSGGPCRKSASRLLPQIAQRTRLLPPRDAERQADPHRLIMGQTLLVTLREGIEMFLIVAIAAAYLRKTGRGALLSAVAWGSITAVGISLVLGVWLAETAV